MSNPFRTTHGRIRNRLRLSDEQWLIVKSVLLILPYPVFIALYFVFSFTGLEFLVVTFVYSLFAMYVGLPG